jgi:hypothetical protein
MGKGHKRRFGKRTGTSAQLPRTDTGDNACHVSLGQVRNSEAEQHACPEPRAINPEQTPMTNFLSMIRLLLSQTRFLSFQAASGSNSIPKVYASMDSARSSA